MNYGKIEALRDLDELFCKNNIFSYSCELLEFYGTENLIKHSTRVYEYYINNPISDSAYGSVLCLLHDLWEDTTLPHDFTDDIYLLKLMKLITHNKEDSYEDYIQRIKDCAREYPEAYHVKLSDIKDHLMLKDTLTDKLKEKYLGALRILL